MPLKLDKQILCGILFSWILSAILIISIYAVIRPWLPPLEVVVGANKLQLDKKANNRLWSPWLKISLEEIKSLHWIVDRKNGEISAQDAKVFFKNYADEGKLITVPIVQSVYPSGLVDWGNNGYIQIGLETEKIYKTNGLIIKYNQPSFLSILSAWINYEPLSGRSINLVIGGDYVDSYISMQEFLFLIGVLGGGLMICMAIILNKSKQIISALILLISFHWVVLDIVWQTNLFKILNVSIGFGQGKSSTLESEYGVIKSYADKLDQFIPAESPVYLYGNQEWYGVALHYFLIPKNVSSMRNSLPKYPLPKGAFLLTVTDKSELKFDPKMKKIQWNNLEQDADLLFSENLIELYIIR